MNVSMYPCILLLIQIACCYYEIKAYENLKEQVFVIVGAFKPVLAYHVRPYWSIISYAGIEIFQQK